MRAVKIIAGFVMGLLLVGCQQAPAPPVVVNQPPAATNSTEHTTTTNTQTKEVETPAPTPTPDNSVQTKTTEQTTTVEKKQQ
jgi:PBP1b-binding outer membrane lipoprotein LpoB